MTEQASERVEAGPGGAGEAAAAALGATLAWAGRDHPATAPASPDASGDAAGAKPGGATPSRAAHGAPARWAGASPAQPPNAGAEGLGARVGRAFGGRGRHGLALAAVASVSLVPLGRAWFEGRSALLATDRALRAGEVGVALGHAREAAGWWVPGSPFVEGAFARMRHIGHTAEAGGDVPAARGAWRALLASAARVRWPTSQLEADVTHARAALARLEAQDLARGALARESAPVSGEAARPATAAGTERRGAAAMALVTLGGLALFVLGVKSGARGGAGALAARWPIALAGVGLAAIALGFGWG